VQPPLVLSYCTAIEAVINAQLACFHCYSILL